MPVRLRPTVPRARSVAALIVLLALAGLALRLGLLVRAGWRYDYDEGMVGLQVLRILRGERPVFHPGQPYLAALESYLIAPFFAAFGADAVTLKLVPWLLAGVYTATTGWLGWRAFDRRVDRGVLGLMGADFQIQSRVTVGACPAQAKPRHRIGLVIFQREAG